jgi:sirohydrochlorin ferrochelatase
MTDLPGGPGRPLVLLAHGTRSSAGVAVVRDVAAAVGRAIGQDVPVGFVDVCGPTADEVLEGVAQPVVVPFFLTSGFHVRVDVPEALGRADRAVGTAALGRSPEVVTALAQRLQETLDGSAVDALLLGGAGSSDVRARQEVHCLAALLSAATGVRARAGFLSGPGPSAAETLADLRASGADRVAAVSLLLAPGEFHRRLAAVGADVTTEPLGVHPALVDLVVRRYRSAG